MNDVIRAIEKRRSVRSFESEQIETDELKLILEAGTYAASGMGRQSGKIIVVQDKETVSLLSKLNARVLGADTDPFYGAPTVLVVMADSNVPTCVEDGALVMGNLMLAAHSLGIGSCWIHRAKEVFETPEGKELMKKWGVPETYRGVGHCILGYTNPNKIGEAKPRKEDFIVWA